MKAFLFPPVEPDIFSCSCGSLSLLPFPFYLPTEAFYAKARVPNVTLRIFQFLSPSSISLKAETPQNHRYLMILRHFLLGVHPSIQPA
jgi:hypothetical protein